MASMFRIVRMTNQFRALWKWFLSFRKRDWELADYPITIRTQELFPASAYDNPRFKLNRYVARIVNWHLIGCGDTHEEALQKLNSTFAAVKSKKKEAGESFPRPGMRVPLEFASQQRVKAHTELAEDFIHRVLELESAWISDESSLWDFHADENNDAYINKIKEIYGVDVSDIQSANLAEILERIASARKHI
ncbi:MAG: hypothetical protein ACLPM3_14985 [Terracidiphilus sp.]